MSSSASTLYLQGGSQTSLKVKLKMRKLIGKGKSRQRDKGNKTNYLYSNMASMVNRQVLGQGLISNHGNNKTKKIPLNILHQVKGTVALACSAGSIHLLRDSLKNMAESDGECQV